jgi:hypothetical protein
VREVNAAAPELHGDRLRALALAFSTDAASGLRRVSRSSGSAATRVSNWLEEGASTVHELTSAGRLLEGHVWGQFGHESESAPVRCISRRDR